MRTATAVIRRRRPRNTLRGLVIGKMCKLANGRHRVGWFPRWRLVGVAGYMSGSAVRCDVVGHHLRRRGAHA
jgi:hypothetical protein